MDPSTPRFVRIAQRSCQWAERWYPETFVFAVATLAVVALAAWLHGTGSAAVAVGFGEGFWSLIPFTMQMTFIIIGGYVTADSPPVAALMRRLAMLPRTGRGAVALVALVGLLVSIVHWALGLIVASLLARALARRESLRMDYRAAAAAAYVGVGGVAMLGLSSSAAQLQANPASMPPALLAVTGVIPFGETIFLWQSLLLLLVITVLAISVAWATAPGPAHARTAQDLGVDLGSEAHLLPPRSRPGDWLEYSPLPSLFIVLLGGGWLAHEFAHKGGVQAISSLNTYNLIFLMLGLLLQWRPRRFLDAVARAVPGVAGVLLLFPLYGGIAAILSKAPAADGTTLATALSHFFTHVASVHTFTPILAAYSALLGLFIPSAGGKWIIEAPYVMQAANELHYPLGWAVQVYNAAEALPNLVNPFWMLPVLGLLGLKARDLIGYTLLQFVVLVPVVIGLLWLLGTTVSYHPPLVPTP
jgi:short-chain fatty acids transporter